MKQVQLGSLYSSPSQSKVEQAREEVEDAMAKMEQTRVSLQLILINISDVSSVLSVICDTQNCHLIFAYLLTVENQLKFFLAVRAGAIANGN